MAASARPPLPSSFFWPACSSLLLSTSSPCLAEHPNLPRWAPSSPYLVADQRDVSDVGGNQAATRAVQRSPLGGRHVVEHHIQGLQMSLQVSFVWERALLQPHSGMRRPNLGWGAA
eukprot:scaffold38351_cov63-Phaeocystis_antarctica.AAC.5